MFLGAKEAVELDFIAISVSGGGLSGVDGVCGYKPELFGPVHFVGFGLGLGLRLKSEIRTRARTYTLIQNYQSMKYL
jgi:hypothetical protein